jgi:hypothetical protein
MSFLKENKVFIFLIYINILFVIYLAKVSYKIENFNYILVFVLIGAGISLCWFYHSALRKISHKIIFTLLILAASAIYYWLNAKHVITCFNISIVDNFNIINSLVYKSLPTAFENFKPIFIIVLPILAFIITSFTSKGASNSIIIITLALVITLWYLGYTEEIKKHLFQYVLITLITYCINVFIKNIRRLSRKGIKVSIESSKIFIYTVVMSLIIAGISNILPQEYTGRYASELQGRFYNKFGNVGESGEQKGKKYKYDLAFSGYSNSSKKLGGPISVNKLVALKVKSEQAYYLKGNIKDYYDGFAWEQSEKKYTERIKKEDPMLKDIYSMAYAEKSNEITIYPEELNSSTIFTPSLSYNVDIEKGSVYSDENSTFISGGIIEKPYKVYFYNLGASWERLLNSSSNKNIKDLGAAYYSTNYKKYLQVPDNISARVYDLVYSLTNDKKNNFEKVKAIREYLNKKYPYTLNVSQIPEGQEFLDYFLFTEQKGYCTYFATAETIMCRIAGIPARYVEGFNMSEERDENGLYIVRNENAHAWTEVLYMETQGTGMWYTVDAVPNAVEAIHKEEERAKAELEGSTNENGVPGINPIRKPEQGGDNSAAGNKKFNIPPILIKLIYGVLAVILINVMTLMLFLRKKASVISCKSIIPLYKYSIDRLYTIGYRQSEFMPDIEFVEKMNEELSIKVKEAASLAYREYYGGKEPIEFNKEEYYNFIEAQIRKRQSRLEYFVKKYYFYQKISLLSKKVMVLYRKIKTR